MTNLRFILAGALALSAAPRLASAQSAPDTSVSAPTPAPTFAVRASIIESKRTTSQLGVSASVGPVRLDLDSYSTTRKQNNRAEPVTATLNLIIPLRPLKSSPYFGAGIGAATTRIRNATGANSATTSERKTTVAAKAFVGTNFNRRFFGELGFSFIGKARGLNSSGFSLSLGARF